MWNRYIFNLVADCSHCCDLRAHLIVVALRALVQPLRSVSAISLFSAPCASKSAARCERPLIFIPPPCAGTAAAKCECHLFFPCAGTVAAKCSHAGIAERREATRHTSHHAGMRHGQGDESARRRQTHAGTAKSQEAKRPRGTHSTQGLVAGQKPSGTHSTQGRPKGTETKRHTSHAGTADRHGSQAAHIPRKRIGTRPTQGRPKGAEAKRHISHAETAERRGSQAAHIPRRAGIAVAKCD